VGRDVNCDLALQLKICYTVGDLPATCRPTSGGLETVGQTTTSHPVDHISRYTGRQADPLWMAGVLDGDEQRLYCVRQVCKTNDKLCEMADWAMPNAGAERGCDCYETVDDAPVRCLAHGGMWTGCAHAVAAAH
jgi:hypothetical protein